MTMALAQQIIGILFMLGILALGVQAIRAAGGALGDIGTGIGNALQGLGNGLGAAVSGAGSALGAAFGGLGSGLGSAARGLGGGLGSAVSGLGSAVKSARSGGGRASGRGAAVGRGLLQAGAVGLLAGKAVVARGRTALQQERELSRWAMGQDPAAAPPIVDGVPLKVGPESREIARALANAGIQVDERDGWVLVSQAQLEEATGILDGAGWKVTLPTPQEAEAVRAEIFDGEWREIDAEPKSSLFGGASRVAGTRRTERADPADGDGADGGAPAPRGGMAADARAGQPQMAGAGAAADRRRAASRSRSRDALV